MINPYLIAYIPIALLCVVYFFGVFHFRKKLSNRLFWLVSIVFFVTCGIGEWLKFNVGQDNNQWFYIGKNLFEDFVTWRNDFALFDHGRVFTFLPVGLLNWLGISNPVVLFKVLVTINYLIVIGSVLMILKGRVSKYAAQITVVFFTIMVSCFSEVQFWVFSSEHMVICIYLLYLALVSWDKISGGKRSYAIFFAGFLLVMSAFAKDQFGLVAVCTYLLHSFLLITRESWKRWMIFTLGCVTMTVLFWLVCLQNFSWEQLRAYYFLGMEYQNRTFAEQLPLTMNTDLFLRFCRLTVLNLHFFPFQVAVGCTIYFVFQAIWKKSAILNEHGTLLYLIILNYVLCMLTIMWSKKDIQHYTVFLFPSFILCAAFFLDWVILKWKSQKWKDLALVLFMGYLLISPAVIRDMQGIFPIKGYISDADFIKKDKTFQLISDYVPKSQKVLLWGYANHYMVRLEAKRSSAFLITQFAFPPLESSKFVRDQYLFDIKRHSPDYVLELVGESMFFTVNKQKHSISSAHPEMFDFLTHHYQLILDSCDVRVYKRN